MPQNPMPSADTLETLNQLIAFDTTSRNANLGLIEWVRDRLRRQGVTDTRLTYDERGSKANLFATIGPARDGGLILSGHTDVVPVDGQDWASDPFQAQVRDGRVFGRGACDMKGFIACALASVPALLDMAGERPFHLALSYDEELGCIGVRGLIADLAEQGIRPAACLVGEPTGMKIVVAHKGQRSLRCCVRGREAHASDPDKGLNAIEHAARIITQVQRLAAREAREGYRDPGFPVPHATLGCTLVGGGIAANIVPRDCDFTVDMRYPPGADADALLEELKAYTAAHILPAMKERCQDADVRWLLLNDAPALAEDPASSLAEIVRQAAVTPQDVGRVAYNTEAGLFQRAGIPALVCGPGSIEQAHRPDEFVELAQLAECERFLGALGRAYQTSNRTPWASGSSRE
jgi:acetylornithine deacetylase